MLQENLFHVLVERNVGAAKSVNRLLGIADDEQLARPGLNLHPVRLGGIRGREQEQNFGLQRIGVLELIDENVRESILQFRAYRRIVANQVARDQQQIEEVEPARAPLQFFVDTDQRPQFLAQHRREIRARIVAKLLEPFMQFGAAAKDIAPRFGSKIAAVTLPLPTPARRKRYQHCFERVVIAASYRFEAGRFTPRTRDRVEALAEPVVRFRSDGEFSERFDLGDDRVDLTVARERRRLPRRIEIAPVEKLQRRPARDRPWTAARGQIAAPQQSAHPLARIFEHLFEPSIECGIEHLARNFFGRDFKPWIDLRLHRTLAQQVGAKRMDRADSRFFELPERLVQARAHLAGESGSVARPLDFSAQPELQLTRGFFRERHRDDPSELAAPRLDHRHDSIHQRRRLPGPGRRLDHQRGVEVVANSIANLLIGCDRRSHRGHGISRSFLSDASRAFGFMPARRSSYGPQTRL